MYLFLPDADECKLDVAGCSSSADCINTAGSFSCKCRSGFTGDGFTCKKGRGIDFPALAVGVLSLTGYARAIEIALLCTISNCSGKCHGKRYDSLN